MTSLDISFHGWRGIGPVIEPDLFLWRWRFGFVTITACRVCLLSTIHKFRAAIADALSKTEEG